MPGLFNLEPMVQLLDLSLIQYEGYRRVVPQQEQRRLCQEGNAERRMEEMEPVKRKESLSLGLYCCLQGDRKDCNPGL